MSVIRCSACSAELIPEANFCRQCGATVASSGHVITSEEPTRNLNERLPSLATQRLDPRATSPGPGSLQNSTGNSVAAASLRGDSPQTRRRFPMALLIGSIVVVIVIVIISSVAFVRMRSSGRATESATLLYPGARTVVDMTSDEGRSIQLQTDDPLDRVLTWYEGSLKPTKTMRLTSKSFVLRNQDVTATIASEDNKTNILIKQSLAP